MDVQVRNHHDAWEQRRLQARAWRPRGDHLVVVAPHPDDETLGVGGLITQQAAAGARVTVIAVTDGEAANDSDGDPALATRRRREQVDALGQLGVGPLHCIRLHLPDSSVADHESDVTAAVICVATSDATIAAPGRDDWHPDHVAVGRAAEQAAAALGCELVSYYFWMWHHADPDAVDVPLVSYALGREARARKARALAAHRSQLDGWRGCPPILTEGAGHLAPASWASEYFSVWPK